jgi:hypothetical protein
MFTCARGSVVVVFLAASACTRGAPVSHPATQAAPAGGLAALGPWTGHDDVPASSDPPAGLRPAQVPQFFALGFDDNHHSGLPGSGSTGGVSWVVHELGERKNPDGTPVHASFYLTSMYATAQGMAPTLTRRAWHEAFLAGHELGDHTHTHPHGNQFTQAEWRAEIQKCIDLVAGDVLPRVDLVGFRTPFLEWNDNTFAAVASLGFHYDCSIEDGQQPGMDGKNFHWPYTLDRGSPGDEAVHAHPGLWEMPVHPVIVPPDEACAAYGVAPGLRARMKAAQDYFDPATGKITGADWNLWVEFGMTRAEFVATLKYTLDLRRAGNRAPFLLVAHADLYSDQDNDSPHASLADRQAALVEVVDYALGKPEVRVVSLREVLDWVRNPVALAAE